MYVRNASLANPLTLPNPSQQVTVSDYEAVPTVSYTYTGATASVSNSVSSPQGPASDAVVQNTTKWWELDPTNPSTAVAAQFIQWEPQNTEQSAAHQVLGQQTMNIIASAMMHQDFSAQAELFDPATYDGFQALLVSQKVLFISSPWGKTDTGYFRIGPETGGMSTGYGNKAKNTQLLPSTSAGPHRTVSITAVAQPRPPV